MKLKPEHRFILWYIATAAFFFLFNPWFAAGAFAALNTVLAFYDWRNDTK